MERKVPFVKNEFYHLYNRGVDKRTIFESSADYRRFMMLLYLCNDTDDVRIANVLKTSAYEEIFAKERNRPLVAVGAFCLMPNHFHILATPLADNGITKFMLKLQTGYSMYFNTKNERSGSLFQGPFKSQHAADDLYLRHLYAYIHLNPAKIKDSNWKNNPYSKTLHSYIEKYPFSSYQEYLSKNHAISNPDPFPNYFSSKKEVHQQIADWLQDESVARVTLAPKP